MSRPLSTEDIDLLVARGEDAKTERKQELHYSRSRGEEQAEKRGYGRGLVARRATLPDKLAEEVEFAGHRTCCICRQMGRPIQIAHIDNNPSNNSFDNLAVLCLEHHSEAHATGGLGRRLTPNMVKTFNDNWREIVKVMHSPQVKEEPVSQTGIKALREYQQEVLLEISLICQQWINTYLTTDTEAFGLILGNGEEKWDVLAKACNYPYSEELWDKFYPLMQNEVEPIAKNLESVLLLYPDAIPPPLKPLLVRTLRQLKNIPARYLLLPVAAKLGEESDSPTIIKFGDIFKMLGVLDKEASRQGTSNVGRPTG